VPRARFGVPGQLVLSSDDPYATEAFALELAQAWGLEPLRLGPLGHINAESGLGHWPQGLALAEALLRRVSPAG
jgi:predicted alpha/beta hydrolase family esterase